jgi:molybdenum cofactor biosynthesis protein B
MNRFDDSRSFIPVRIAVLTVSDTRTHKTDKSGPLLIGLLQEAGHELAEHAIAEDNVKSIRKHVKRWIKDPEVDVVITAGGTGFTGRDVTPEAIKPLFEKEIEGFSVLFHMVSYQSVGTSTVQSRACGGLAEGTYIFSVPGSPGACQDAWNGILKAQLDNRHRPCSFVEIIPRLLEKRKKKAKAEKAG